MVDFLYLSDIGKGMDESILGKGNDSLALLFSLVTSYKWIKEALVFFSSTN